MEVPSPVPSPVEAAPPEAKQQARRLGHIYVALVVLASVALLKEAISFFSIFGSFYGAVVEIMVVLLSLFFKLRAKHLDTRLLVALIVVELVAAALHFVAGAFSVEINIYVVIPTVVVATLLNISAIVLIVLLRRGLKKGKPSLKPAKLGWKAFVLIALSVLVFLLNGLLFIMVKRMGIAGVAGCLLFLAIVVLTALFHKGSGKKEQIIFVAVPASVGSVISIAIAAYLLANEGPQSDLGLNIFIPFLLLAPEILTLSEVTVISKAA